MTEERDHIQEAWEGATEMSEKLFIKLYNALVSDESRRLTHQEAMAVAVALCPRPAEIIQTTVIDLDSILGEIE
jgi:hypothetical protein